jgi:hypothetical protein
MGVEFLTIILSFGAVAASIGASVAAWIKARGRTHKITLTIDGATLELHTARPEDAEKIIEAWLARFPAEERESGK